MPLKYLKFSNLLDPKIKRTFENVLTFKECITDYATFCHTPEQKTNVKYDIPANYRVGL